MNGISRYFSHFFSPVDASMLASARMTFVFAMLSAMSPLGMDSYLPAVNHFATSLGVSTQQASWTLSNYLIGLGLGQMCGGALSDQKGRRQVTIWGLLLFSFSSFAVVWWQTLPNALFFRFLQGAGGGLMMVCGVAMIKDTTHPQKLAERLSFAMFIVMMMPALAPILGSVLLLFFTWPVIFYVSGLAGVVLLLFFFFKVPETLNTATGKLSLLQAYKQYAYVVQHRVSGRRIAITQALCNALGSAAILIYVVTAPAILMAHFSITSNQFPIAFGIVVAAMQVGNRIGRYCLSRTTAERLFLYGMPVYFVSVLGFFCFSLVFDVSLVAYVSAIVLCAGAHATVNAAGQAMYLNLLDKHYGSATALEQAMRFALGGVFGGIAAALSFGPILSVSFTLLVSAMISALAYYWGYRYWSRLC